MFISFKKYSFEECIRRLKCELESITSKPQTNDTTTSHQTSSSKTGTSSKSEQKESADGKKNVQCQTNNPIEPILAWTEAQALNWLESKNLNIPMLKPCNGRVLYQLFSLMHSAPEFFYQSFKNENNSMSLKELASFSYELNCLFKNQ
jgi:hypothetical protein